MRPRRAGAWLVAIGGLPATAVVLAACATGANYDRLVRSWVGADRDALVRVWGVPATTFQLQDGHVVLVYEERRQYTRPVVITPGETTVFRTGDVYREHTAPSTISGGETIDLVCRTEFETDGGRIVAARHRGNDCAARKDDPRAGPSASPR